MASRYRRRRRNSRASSSTHTWQSGQSQQGGTSRNQLPFSPSHPSHRERIHHTAPFSNRLHESSPDAAPAHVHAHHVVAPEEVDEDLEHVVMAIDRHQKGAIGCAYYIAREEKLYCLLDVMHGNLDAIETLKLDVRPTIILLSSRVDADTSELEAGQGVRGTLAAHLDDVSAQLRIGGEAPPLPYQVDIRPLQEFAYEAAKTKLINLETMLTHNYSTSFLVPGEASTYEDEQDQQNFGSTNRQGKLLRLSCWIDFENRTGIGCVGAILTHLQRRRAANYLPNDPDAERAFGVREVEMVSLRETMFINPDTLLSLQIIQPESHPIVFNQGPGSTGSKESLSLYGLFHHYAHTPQGKISLRQVFLRPSLNLEEITSRMDFVGVFVRPDNLIPLQKLSRSLSRVKNIRTVMTYLHKGINGANQKFGGLRSGVWRTLLEFAYHTIDIRDTLREVMGAEHLPLVAKAVKVLDTRMLQAVGSIIHDIVDLDPSTEQGRTVVKRGIDDQLDNMKNMYDGMDDLLSQTAIDIAQTLPEYVAAKLNVIYFPQLGYHITMPVDPATGDPIYGGRPDDPVGGGMWERMFSTENQVYLKDARMRTMDERLGDLWNMICDVEIEISYHLAQRVLQHETTLIAASDLCGELDCVLALAQGANQYKLVRPCITVENKIDIKECRHLLQEMTVPSYVANDGYLVGGRGLSHSRTHGSSRSHSSPSSHPTSSDNSSGPSMLLLTGPNFSGKSVYLKSIAQAIYLAHLGSFIPCSSTQTSTIGLTDAILTRIRTCETVSRPHSAFMIDLQQVAMILRQATRRSLVVIDEFGKGTDTGDGAGLACGLFQHLLSRGPEAPKSLVATHFHEIFEQGYLPAQHGLSFAHMEVRVDRRPPQRRPGQHPTSSFSSSSASSSTTTTNSSVYETGLTTPSSSDTDTSTEVTYLYNLRAGRSHESFGTQCAAMSGVPGLVVERARRLGGLVARGEDLVSVCAGIGVGENGVEEMEDLERAEGLARGFLEWDLDLDIGVEGDGEVGSENGRWEDTRAVLERLLDRMDEGAGVERGSEVGVEAGIDSEMETETDSNFQN